MSYTIDTNLEPGRIPDRFLADTSDFLCALFDRPKKVIMGQLRAGQEFDFSGSADPCAVMHLTRGSQKPRTVSDESVERYVTAISEHVERTLGVPRSRLMIFYHEHDLALIGNDGKTLKRIWSDIGTFPSD